MEASFWPAANTPKERRETRHSRRVRHMMLPHYCTARKHGCESPDLVALRDARSNTSYCMTRTVKARRQTADPKEKS